MVFREARIHNAIVFFDECEALFASRATTGSTSVNTLLTEMERFEGLAILATNRPQVITITTTTTFIFIIIVIIIITIIITTTTTTTTIIIIIIIIITIIITTTTTLLLR
jgi:hypothetical protein